MNLSVLVLWISVLCGLAANSLQAVDVDLSPVARQGRIDFSSFGQILDRPEALNGQWEFYWNELLFPADFKAENPPEMTGYVHVPGYWNDYTVNQSTFNGHGYATFRLLVENIVPDRIISLRLNGINSAYAIYANGVLVGRCGTVGGSRDTSVSRICPQAAGFYLDQPQIELILHISNYRHNKGGIWREITLAEYHQMESRLYQQLAIDMFLIGALLIMGLYYIGVFSLRTKEKSTLFFGLFCLVMSLRTSFHNACFFYQLFPDFELETYLKLDYLTLTIPVVLFLSYILLLYPKEFSKKVYWFFSAAAVLFSLLTIGADSYFFTGLLLYYQLLILLACAYLVYVVVRALLRQREGAAVMLIGCLILIASIVNDILHAQSVINTAYVIGFGLFLFFFSQAFVITKRFTDALRTSEELSSDLELKVKDQTSEIRDLLDNTGQGILSFDKDMKVQQHASRAAHAILGPAIKGESIVSLMFPEVREKIEGYLMILFQSKGKINLVKDLLPARFVKDDKYYDLSFRWIPAGRKTPDRVMVILTDVTVKRKLEKMLEQDEQKNRKIIRIAADRHGFLRFYNNIRGLLAAIEDKLSPPVSPEVTAEIFSLYHTMKGGLAGYAFFEVAEIAGRAEDHLQGFIDNKEAIPEAQIPSLLNLSALIESTFITSIYELGDLIPKQLLQISSMTFYRISEEKVHRLEQYLDERLGDDLEVAQIIENLRKQPLRNMMKRIVSDAKDLAFQMGKQVDVLYSGEENQVNHSHLDDFFVNVNHLVRNAIDHGIELPHERKMSGKPETGMLTMDVSLQDGTFIMVFADDGRGLAIETLKQRAKEKRIITQMQADAMSDGEAMELIFTGGLSTRESISNFSGRGIGMSAVRSSVTDLGGRIAVASQAGKGTTFTITIPLSS